MNLSYQKRNPEKTREILRRYHQSHPEKHRENARLYRKLRPEKSLVYNAVLRAVRTGKLIRPACCELCGADDSKLHGHHDDYSKPLEVRWVCSACHAFIHVQRKGASCV
jgi:hypothetical protein